MSYMWGLSLVAWTLLHTPRRIETRQACSIVNPSKGETRIAGRSLADGSPSGERVDEPNEHASPPTPDKGLHHSDGPLNPLHSRMAATAA